MPKVSIIIPVYNVEQYLRECLDSVVGQTLRDLEIICVDDGSTDGCPAILEEYAGRDPRFKVIHKENGGYGQAMNVGMAAASGDYIGIVESDDLIREDMYEALYSQAARHELDVVRSDYDLYWGWYQYTERVHRDMLDGYYGRVLTGQDRDIFWWCQTANWTGIYKRSFLEANGIRHRESPGAAYQDTGFYLQVMGLAQRAMLVNQSFYLYRQDNPGASIRSRGKMLAVREEYDFAAQILEGKGCHSVVRVVNALRMGGHNFTFGRLDHALKREYAGYIQEDFLRYRDTADWIKAPGGEAIFQWTQSLIQDPDGFCRDCVEVVRREEEALREAEQIILYGAGQLGRRAATKLLEMGLEEKILFAAETTGDGTGKLFHFPVKNAREILPCKDTALVLVAAGRKNSPQIIRYLEGLGITNYLGVENLHLWY